MFETGSVGLAETQLFFFFTPHTCRSSICAQMKCLFVVLFFFTFYLFIQWVLIMQALYRFNRKCFVVILFNCIFAVHVKMCILFFLICQFIYLSIFQ